MDLAPLLGSHSPKIEKIIDKTVSEELDPSAMSAPRGKRKSKVIESIINRLKELGTGNASQLRHALAAARLSESSLSTGLAILQKSGQIKRDDDGSLLSLGARGSVTKIRLDDLKAALEQRRPQGGAYPKENPIISEGL